MSEKCPLCDGSEVKVNKVENKIGLVPVQGGHKAEFPEAFEYLLFACPRCGKFKMTKTALEDWEGHRDIKEQKHLISGYTRECLISKREPPLLKSNNNFETFKFIISQAPTKPLDKINRLLMNLAGMSSFPGEVFFITSTDDYTLGYCENRAECEYYIAHLLDSNLLEKLDGKLDFCKVKITVKGWEKIEELQKTSSDSSQVFIAMNFDKKYDSCYENGIKKALEKTKYKPYRIDRVEHIDRIDDKILAEIKRSKFIIAEFTGQKHGVYFEAGYATGLGIRVIWTCAKKDIDNLHFDTRQFNHIIWDTEDELKEGLINRIRFLFGDNK